MKYRIRRTTKEWTALIQECRASGLTDKQWCQENGVVISSFYRAIKRLRDAACTIPHRESAASPLPTVQDIVPVDPSLLMESAQSSAILTCNERQYFTTPSECQISVTLSDNTRIDISNNASTGILREILLALRTS